MSVYCFPRKYLTINKQGQFEHGLKMQKCDLYVGVDLGLHVLQDSLSP